jgi:hypothetical protein
MLVDLEDGQCRTCQNQLEIVDFDDVSLHVQCTSCGDSYEVETDAFGDGCLKYYFSLVAMRRGYSDSAEDPL